MTAMVVPTTAAQTGADKVMDGRSWAPFRDEHECVKYPHSPWLFDDENFLGGMATNQRKKEIFLAPIKHGEISQMSWEH